MRWEGRGGERGTGSGRVTAESKGKERERGKVVREVLNTRKHVHTCMHTST